MYTNKDRPQPTNAKLRTRIESVNSKSEENVSQSLKQTNKATWKIYVLNLSDNYIFYVIKEFD